jgi:acyl-CoA thioester hydrolase
MEQNCVPRIFVKTFKVLADAIDMNNHVNNLEYLRWMQDVAIQHSTAQGWPVERYMSIGSSWVVRSHYIKYIRPAFLGDAVSIVTWISSMSMQESPRRYLFWRASDNKVLAEAETLWVFVDLRTGRPCPISEQLKSAFDIVSEDNDEILNQVCLGGG